MPRPLGSTSLFCLMLTSRACLCTPAFSLSKLLGDPAVLSWMLVCSLFNHPPQGTSVQVPCFLSPVEPCEHSCRVLCERGSSFPWGNTRECTRWLAHGSARLTVLRNRLASQVAIPCHRPNSNRGDLGPLCPHSTWCSDRQDECPPCFSERVCKTSERQQVTGGRQEFVVPKVG